MSIAEGVLLLQLAATFSLVGLIWFVQIVHYPLMAVIGSQEFRRYEMEHQRLTTRIVAPLMLCELLSGLLLFWFRPAGLGVGAVILGCVLLSIIWLRTFAVHVPQHASLAMAYDPRLQRQLVTGNWYRTAAWTARGFLVLWMLSRVIPGTI